MNMKYSIDLQDIIDKNYLNLWTRYKPLQMVYYKKISEYIRRDLYEFGFEEFCQDAYIVLVNAANGVKVEKVKNPETYSFYVQYSQWLHNFTSRDIVGKYIHNYAVKYMDYNKGQDGESNFEWDSILETEESHSNMWDLIKTLPPEFQKRAEKVAFGQRTGGAKWPREIKEYILKYYSSY